MLRLKGLVGTWLSGTEQQPAAGGRRPARVGRGQLAPWLVAVVGVSERRARLAAGAVLRQSDAPASCLVCAGRPNADERLVWGPDARVGEWIVQRAWTLEPSMRASLLWCGRVGCSAGAFVGLMG